MADFITGLTSSAEGMGNRAGRACASLATTSAAAQRVLLLLLLGSVRGVGMGEPEATSVTRVGTMAMSAGVDGAMASPGKFLSKMGWISHSPA